MLAFSLLTILLAGVLFPVGCGREAEPAPNPQVDWSKYLPPIVQRATHYPVPPTENGLPALDVYRDGALVRRLVRADLTELVWWDDPAAPATGRWVEHVNFQTLPDLGQLLDRAGVGDYRFLRILDPSGGGVEISRSWLAQGHRRVFLVINQKRQFRLFLECRVENVPALPDGKLFTKLMNCPTWIEVGTAESAPQAGTGR